MMVMIFDKVIGHQKLTSLFNEFSRSPITTDVIRTDITMAKCMQKRSDKDSTAAKAQHEPQ